MYHNQGKYIEEYLHVVWNMIFNIVPSKTYSFLGLLDIYTTYWEINHNFSNVLETVFLIKKIQSIYVTLMKNDYSTDFYNMSTLVSVLHML